MSIALLEIKLYILYRYQRQEEKQKGATLQVQKMNFKSKYYLVDIDGTITDYRAGSVTPDKMLHGNFLFPIIRDMMLERGWEKQKAETAIYELAERIVFWDYTDFIAEFKLPVKEAIERMRQWHFDNLFAYPETVDLVKKLKKDGKQLFVMSNNPYIGCVFKLQAAGLADDDFASPYFKRIFGTNILRGCKCVPDVWKRAFAQIPADISEIGVIGDNPKEDGELPRSLGVIETIIIPRAVIAHGVENAGK
jgi:FMN phosphatase YigB (HAD superfamily)